MYDNNYLPIFALSRGDAVESVHFGAFAVVNSRGKLVASYGNPDTISFLRSSAKPFQALPFIEADGHEQWGLSGPEISIMCASHSGTDKHFKVLTNIQSKIKVTQEDLLCGIHPPVDAVTRQALLNRGESPTPNRHNCSGKHTGMLAHAKFTHTPIEDYIDIDHPIQKRILATFSEMCDVDVQKIALGIDGCSAPVFAIPLKNAALGYARLCDPHDLAPERAAACRTITAAMMEYPDMVAGPGKFDTRLMEVSKGKIVSKGGAEGYQQVGILPGVLSPNSPGLGIALKISDGDARSRARPAVILEILRQLGAITESDLEKLAEFGPKFPTNNWREIIVGQAHPIFKMNTAG